MRQKVFFILLLSFSTSYFTHAQEKEIAITLEESVQASLKHNPILKMAEADMRMREASVTQSKAFFLPGLDVSYGGFYTNNPLNAFGFKLQQEGITQNDFNPLLLNNPDATENYSFKISFAQPIFNPDLWLKAKATRLALEAETLSTERKKEFVTYQVKSLYYQVYLAYKSLDVAAAYKQTLQEALQQSEARFKGGYLQQADVLKIKAELLQAETEVITANKNYEGICDQLSLAMGNALGFLYVPTSIEKESTVYADSILANQNRKDFLAMQKALLAQEKVVQAEKNNVLPSLNAFGDWLTNDNSPTGFGANAYLAGFQLSWKPFTGLYRSGKIEEEKAKLAKQKEQYQQYLNSSELERRQTQLLFVQLNQTELAAKQGAEVAQEIFRITSDRFAQGLTSSTELLMAGTKSKQQQLNLLYITTTKLSTIAYQEFLK
jgi:outer membrane protein TolC